MPSAAVPRRDSTQTCGEPLAQFQAATIAHPVSGDSKGGVNHRD